MGCRGDGIALAVEASCEWKLVVDEFMMLAVAMTREAATRNCDG